MKKPKPTYAHTLLTYDGERWSYYAGATHEMILRQSFIGAAQVIPAEIISELQAAHTTHTRLLLAGEVHRLEVGLPTNLSFKEVNRIITSELADMTNVDVAEMITAGATIPYPGVAEPIVLTAAFVKDRITALHQQLIDAGVLITGVASLEMACMATWMTQSKHTETLLIMGHTHDLVIPGRRRGENPGPTSLSGGMRYLEMDELDWLNRLQRGVRFLDKQQPCSVLSLMVREGPTAVMRAGGFSETVTIEREPFLNRVINEAALVRANLKGALLPMVNPYVPRKRFSHAWIVVPTLLLMASPYLYWGVNVLYRNHHATEYQQDAAPYLPLEQELKTARQAKQSATWALQQEQANFNALVNRRKPLAAFIHTAYFFCKFAGVTVSLEKIEEQDGKILVSGTMGDPEDRLRINQSLKSFTKKYGLVIIENKLSDSIDEEGNPVSHFDLTLSYQNLKDPAQ